MPPVNLLLLFPSHRQAAASGGRCVPLGSNHSDRLFGSCDPLRGVAPGAVGNVHQPRLEPCNLRAEAFAYGRSRGPFALEICDAALRFEHHAEKLQSILGLKSDGVAPQTAMPCCNCSEQIT